MLLWLPVVLLGIPTAVFSIEVARGTKATVTAAKPRAPGIRAAVLIPAHNEEQQIANTLRQVKAQLEPSDRVLVIADNCTDRTAAIAREHGAEVLERRSDARGKGHALSFGIEALAADPPDIVVIVDADCDLRPDCLPRLVSFSWNRQQPAQADYIMRLPENPSTAARISTFAFRVRNRIRPLGLWSLGLPVHLAGTGMAFPWAVLRQAPDTHGHVAEDLLLGLELSCQGSPVLFCPSARVESELASTSAGQNTQRERWEHGHLRLLASHLPKLFRQALARKRPVLLATAADLSIPPLSFHCACLAATGGITALGALVGGGAGPLLVASLEGASLLGAVGFAWHRAGRDLLPARSLISLVPYAVGKIPSYLRFGTGRGVHQWRRTERSRSPSDALH